MIIWTGVILIAASATASGEMQDLAVTQVMVRQRTFVRVPMRAEPAAPSAKRAWRERKGPKCVPAARIAGAAGISEGSVDFLLRRGGRMRAEFEDDCPNLDYYSGFYLRPGADGQVCADRDAVHVRSGGQCQIERFRVLEKKGGKRGGSVLDQIRRRFGR